MSELGSVHRYVAGGLLALALNHAQLHQHVLPTAWSPASEDNSAPDENDSSWSSEQSNLLHHVFRHLNIDPKAWVGLETTAMSPDARHHVGAFVRILTEEEVGPPSEANGDASKQAALATAVDAMDLKLRESEGGTPIASSISDGDLPDEQSGAKDKAAESDDTEPLLHTNSASEGPVTSETVFTAHKSLSRKGAVVSDNELVPGSSPTVNTEKPLAADDQGTVEGEPVASSEELPDSPTMTPAMVMERQRKIAVLYELLIACVADTPEEKAGKSVLRAGYDARHRVALRLLATWLDISWRKVAAMEVMVAYMALATQKEASKDGKEESSKSTWKTIKRGGIIGAAALAGGALLALTGGLAAPAIAAGLASLAPVLGPMMPLIGTTGLAAAFAAAGTTAGSVAVAASFGAAGAGLAGSKMARRIGGVSEFEFIPVGDNHQQGRLAVSILVSGTITETEDFVRPWIGPDSDVERYALRWETKELMAVATAMEDWMTSTVAREVMKQGAMMTVLAGLVTALAWPVAILSVVDFIDSKWSIAVDRSDKAGKLLAKILLGGAQGNRPVTLMGFSLGARLIFSCLETLAKHGEAAAGIVERVVLLGAPIPLDQQRWETVRKVVAGRFINCYSTNDWILGIAYRATCLTQGLAGIQKVTMPGIENVDVTEVVDGHFAYLTKMGQILKEINVDSYYPIFPTKLRASREIVPAV